MLSVYGKGDVNTLSTFTSPLAFIICYCDLSSEDVWACFRVEEIESFFVLFSFVVW